VLGLARFKWEDPHELLICETFRKIALQAGGNGLTFRASLRRVACYSKIGRKRIQTLIHRGPAAQRGKQAKPGLVARRILVPRAPHNAGKWAPTTYELNVGALREDPRMQTYVEELQQGMLATCNPRRAREEGVMTVHPPLAHRVHQGGAPGAVALAHQVHLGGAPGAHNLDDLDDSSTPSFLASSKSSASTEEPMMLRSLSSPERDQTDSEREYIRIAQGLFQAQPCIQAAFSKTNEGTAADLYRSGISTEVLGNAILLGCARNYISAINNGRPAPIRSLRYFLPVVEEICQQHFPAGYWQSVRHRLPKLEKQWMQLVSGKASSA